jgi:hypothetical protein
MSVPREQPTCLLDDRVQKLGGVVRRVSVVERNKNTPTKPLNLNNPILGLGFHGNILAPMQKSRLPNTRQMGASPTNLVREKL